MSLPIVTVAILAKQNAKTLPLYLKCIEALDYPRDRINLNIRTNDSTDETTSLLRRWYRSQTYRSYAFNDSSVDPSIAAFANHEWNTQRFKVLGGLRQEALDAAVFNGSDYLFTVDCDNYIKSSTLRALVDLQLPIVAPLLRHTDTREQYSNYHYRTTHNGYIEDVPEYYQILTQSMRGIFAVDCVHCTYLVKCSEARDLRYVDSSERHEYVVFSEHARAYKVQQYLDNREVYGYLNMNDDPTDAAKLLGVPLES